MKSSNFFRTTAFALLLSSGSYAATAAPDPGVRNTVIKHLSSDNQHLLFQVDVANESGEKFTILIKDNSGNILYRGVYSDKNFSRKFQFPKGDNSKLTFVIKSNTDNKSESYEVNSSTKLVEEVVVTKLR